MADYEDDYLDDDDITTTYDGEADDGEVDSGRPLSFEEQERRQEAFENEVIKRRNMLRKPKNYNPQERVEAAYWLGEAGDPTAIPELVLVYQRDKTKGMKEAATYALGMFKAMQYALDDPEVADSIYATTERVVMHGEFGQRYVPGQFRLPQLGLGALFVVLLIVGGAIGALTAKTPEEIAAAQTAIIALTPTATPDTFEAAEADLTTYYGNLSDDARILQGQMSSVTRGESQDCNVNFTNPPAYTLSQGRQGDANFAQITERLNQLRTDLAPVRDAFNEACNTRTAIARADGLTFAQTVINVQSGLTEVGALFNPETVEIPPTLEFTATPTQPATPVPTVDIALIRSHVDSLQFILDGMVGFNGKATTQVIWWQNIMASGSSEGCFQPETVVPDNYDLPVDIAANFPELASAAENVNAGLALMRDTSATFFQGCASNDKEAFFNAAQVGLERAQLAVQAFNEAQASLDALQGR